MAAIALQSPCGVGIEANKMLKHALWISVAKDGALERLFCSGVYKSDGYEVFESEKRVVLKHLQS